ncbi:MAG: tRNA (N(6)-L-threonylcarbamoyladenosine(37)-C(2))-methylthiotransferase MtaB [Limnochordia bacterium]|jgi:threonylcarbamoyladenosine tRNA methylthiotransferase MtaB
MGKKVALETLGCKVNQYETEAVGELFRRRGYRLVDPREAADVYVINTCTVTSASDRKCRQAIRRYRRLNPQALVVAMGCYTQHAPEEIAALPGVAVVVGVDQRGLVVDLVEQALEEGPGVQMVHPAASIQEFEELPIETFRGRTRAFIKVQDGCNQHCTYCKVRLVRGPSRSRDPMAVKAEVERLAQAGFKEIVLTGVHLGGYGQDLPGEWDLSRLIHHIRVVDGIQRIRISSVDPHEVTLELLETLELNNVCRHLHIPLQSGSDKILRLMGRKYTTEQYEKIVNFARDEAPGLAISTDIIVGFPGEEEEDFASTLAFVRRMKFSRLHVFTYSPRPKTPAARLKDLPKKVKEERSHRLIQLGDELQLDFHRQLLGQVEEVLLEAPTKEPGFLEGLTDNYVRVVVSGPGELAGSLAPVRILAAHKDHVDGELCLMEAGSKDMM